MGRQFLLMVSVLLVTLGWAHAAGADGKVFQRMAEDQRGATMPDQQALIYFKNGVETLAIETRVTGAASDFAWVVPLPAAPEITAATPGLFKTLRAMHQPRIVANYRGFAVVMISIAVVLMVGLVVKRARATMLVGVIVAFCVVVMMLPSLGKARGSGGVQATQVTELSRHLVGDFDVTVVQSSEAGALVRWLDERDYHVSEAAKTVIAAYVADGWVFAATRLRADRADERQLTVTPHPLVFKFRTDAPVYPMRLTGVENGGPLAVDLYVLASEGAKAEHFSVERCGEAVYGRARGPDVGITHRWLVEHAPHALVATKLSAVLQPEQMVQDVRITLAPRHDIQQVRWTSEAATKRAVDIGLGVALVSLIITVVVSRSARPSRGLSLELLTIGAGAALLAAMVTYAFTDVTAAVRRAREVNLDSVAYRLTEASEDRVAGGTPLDEQWLRDTAARLCREHARDPSTLPILEDSPGNYQVVLTDDTWAFLWYDLYGVENAYPLNARTDAPRSPSR